MASWHETTTSFSCLQSVEDISTVAWQLKLQVGFGNRIELMQSLTLKAQEETIFLPQRPETAPTLDTKQLHFLSTFWSPETNWARPKIQAKYSAWYKTGKHPGLQSVHINLIDYLACHLLTYICPKISWSPATSDFDTNLVIQRKNTPYCQSNNCESVMIWGFFAASGPEKPAIIDGTINSASYPQNPERECPVVTCCKKQDNNSKQTTRAPLWVV